MRTISIKLEVTPEQDGLLKEVRASFIWACNYIATIALENRVFNQIKLHHAAYYTVVHSENSPGSQMTCNAIKAASRVSKVLKKKKNQDIPKVVFRPNGSVHYDKKTYTIFGDVISLFTRQGRIDVPMILGCFQQDYLKQAKNLKEAELICKRDGTWYFNLVLEIPYQAWAQQNLKALGVDLGENNLATTSTGKIFSGGQIRFDRDCYLALRRRLQCNGTRSSKQLLGKISGQEARHMRHINHCISKAIIEEAIRNGCNAIVLEELKNIRKHIKAGKRMRSRLHRWAWAQLQEFIKYKAQAAGLLVIFVNPAYTSKTCADCGTLGTRVKHHFKCMKCGIQRHSDFNASLNIRRIGESIGSPTGTVNCPNVPPPKRRV